VRTNKSGAILAPRARQAQGGRAPNHEQAQACQPGRFDPCSAL